MGTLRHKNPFYHPLIIANSVKYSVIKTESIKIIKERELPFFFTLRFPPQFFLFLFPSPQFYYFPSSSSSFYCFLSFTHSFRFSFSTRFYKRLPTAIFSSFWNNVSWRKKNERSEWRIENNRMRRRRRRRREKNRIGRRRSENKKIVEKGIKKEKNWGGKRSVKKDSSLC